MAKQTSKHLRMDKVIYLSGQKKTMAYAKLVWLLTDILGIPLTILGIIINLDNIKSVILFILLTIYLCLRIYYYAVQKKQAVREKEIDIRVKELDAWEREQIRKKVTSTTANQRK